MGLWTTLYRTRQRVRRLAARAWAWTSALANLRNPPPSPGMTGTIAGSPTAEMDLKRLASSPSVYAAVTRRALGLLVYPVRVSRGWGPGQPKEVIDPTRAPFAQTLLRLLARPDPADVGRVFPARPGMLVLAQVLADLLLAGNAFLRLQRGPGGGLVGLHRLHPQAVLLVRMPDGSERWEYRPAGRLGEAESYERGDVAHLRLLSWERSGAGELGTGAAEPLRDLLDAERSALESTAAVVSQGGADVRITGKSAAMANYLRDEKNRREVADQAADALSAGKTGRRVFVVGGDLEVTDSGLKPADIQAPEVLDAARMAALMAIGVVPVEVGADAGSYATAVQQVRVQYELDLHLAMILEVCLLQPLAQALAAAGGGRWAQRASEITAWIDLATHPGAQLIRTEAIGRMVQLVGMGWTASQAAEAEGIELPEPEGQPMSANPFAAPPPSQGPRRPVGDGSSATEATSEPAAPPQDAARFWRSLRRAEQPEPLTDARAALWTRAEAARARSDADLQAAAERVLAEEERRYLEAIVPRLEAAARTARPRTRAEGEDPTDPAPTDYGDLQVDAILPDADADLYLSGMGPSWLTTWEEGAAGALDPLPDVADGVPVPSSTPTTLDPLAEASRKMARTTRERVRDWVQAGVDSGRSPQEIARDLRDSGAFSEGRALTIARTETVRAQSEGTAARYQEAEAAGVQLEQEWLSARDGNTRPEHLALDGQRAPVGGSWTFRDGTSTRGPGLSGDPAHDANCRCAVVPVLA